MAVFFRLILLCLVGGTSIIMTAATANDDNNDNNDYRPELHLTARIKQHRQGANGDLVVGEEELRKIKLGWDSVPNAKLYEICHQCSAANIIDNETGKQLQKIERNGDDDDGGPRIIQVPIGRANECGGKPCLVLPGAPLGKNTFHLRVQQQQLTRGYNNADDDADDDGNDNEEYLLSWSLWSKVRNFNINEPGTTQHTDEDEL